MATRDRIIRSRLKDHYTEEELKEAIRGAANDPWEGRLVNGNDDFKYILKDGPTVEKFRDLWRNGPPKPTAKTSSIDRDVMALMGRSV